MRISDWSSDVCSSDLMTITVDPVDLAKALIAAPSISPATVPVFALLRTDHERAAGQADTLPAGVIADDWLKEEDRKSVVSGKSVSVRVDHGGRRIIKKKNTRKITNTHISNNTI